MVVGYLFLVGYDWLVLCYIGKLLLLLVVMMGGLMVYVFGNIIGLLVILGVVVCWWVYFGLGLDGYDIVVILIFMVVFFGVGVLLLGFLVLVLYFGVLGLILFLLYGMIWLLVIVVVLIVMLLMLWVLII